MSDNAAFTLIFTGVWCLVGVIFLGVGIAFRRSFLKKEERLRARASGTITEVMRRVRHGSDGASVNWYPIVEFEAEGRRISLECEEGGGRKAFYEGQPVEVLYDPDDPSCFRLEGRSATSLLGNIFLAVGLGCIAIGVAVGWIVNAASPGIHFINHTR